MTSKFTLLLWLAGFLGNVSLCFVMFVKKHWSRFPIFTLLAAYEALRAIPLFIISHAGAHSAYTVCYWSSESLDVILQVALLYEVGSQTIFSRQICAYSMPSRPLSTFILTLAVTAAAICSLLVPSVAGVKETVDMRASLFTSILTCELYLLILSRMNRLRLKKNHGIMAICNGITLWAICEVLSDLLHQANGWENQSIWFDTFNSVIVVLMLSYWIVSFWRLTDVERNGHPDIPVVQMDAYSHSKGLSR